MLLGNGLGGLAAAVNFTVDACPRSVAIADLNGDTHVDLVTVNSCAGNVSVLLGNGLGGFAPATSFPAGPAPYSVAIGDLNGDSMLDLATADAGSPNGSVSVLFGNGFGSFAPF